MVLALSPFAYSTPSETRFVGQREDWSLHRDFDLFWDEATAWHATLSTEEWMLSYSCAIPDTSGEFEHARTWPHAYQVAKASGMPDEQIMHGPWNPIDRIMSHVHDRQSGIWRFHHRAPLPHAESYIYERVIARIDDRTPVNGGSFREGTQAHYVLKFLTPTHFVMATRLRLLIGNDDPRMYDLPLGSGLSASAEWVDLQCNLAPALRRVREQHTREHVRVRLCAGIHGPAPLAIAFRKQHCDPSSRSNGKIAVESVP
ncbi:MAG: hypothetical protein OXI55_14595 [Gammaproteobacteria bacterium]|nr:hypothetical protein [Gammaproteobacteria bacterium]